MSNTESFFDKISFDYDIEEEFLAKKPIVTEFDQRLLTHASLIQDLNSMITLHPAQVVISIAIFRDGRAVVFVECGRKFGKTELMMYFLSRIAMSIPNAALYYIAPFGNQAGELLWHNGRLPNFYPDNIKEKYSIRPRNSDYRILFGFNGSFIKLAGADNYDAYRGVNPHGVGYEEFKDHHPEFHKAMSPNLLTYEAPLMIIGTPPEAEDNQFCELADFAKNEPDEAWFNFPSWANPHVSTEWLRKEKRKLFKQNKEDEWFREYCAKRVKSGKRHIFGRFDDTAHVMPFDKMMKLIERSQKDWNFFCTADPGSAKCFAVLFTAIHKYKKLVFHMDEIYEETPANMATRKMMESCIENGDNKDGILLKLNELHPWLDEWTYTYDEAALWFQTEVLNNYGDIYPDINFMPTDKTQNKKDSGITLINDQIAAHKFYMSDRCVKFKFEMNNYVKDSKGNVPKTNDHLIDDGRYTNSAAFYALPDEKRPTEKEPNEMKRGHSFNDDFREENRKTDYVQDFDNSQGGWF